MKNFKFEYIWLDGYDKEQNLRSKVKVLSLNSTPTIKELPLWSFDGSSTKQATGDKSDCLLKPVKMITDPFYENSFLVMCEVLNTDETPHVSNTRSLITTDDDEDSDFWFGFEQEYVLINPQTNKPTGFPSNGYPKSQGMYYCGVGNENVNNREFMNEHLELCLKSGLEITGINHEVMIGQFEYQILSRGLKNAGDELWLSRYILYRLGEKYGYNISLHPKPVVEENFNGSGCHCNFSNKLMREMGGKDLILGICKELEKNHDFAISKYGSDNHLRLTGKFETQDINKFSYGVSDRGASIRIPVSTAKTWKGYLEDRRPSSNCDPYKVVDIIKTAVQLSSINILEKI